MTWRDMIVAAITKNGEGWRDVEASTLTNAELDREIKGELCGPQGAPFTLWTRKRVYFPVQFDGAEWVASVSRHPDGKKTEHIGS